MASQELEPAKRVRDYYKTMRIKLAPVPRQGALQLLPGQGEDGYGMKITTDYMVELDGKVMRVYAGCVSNVASYYVCTRRGDIYISDHSVPPRSELREDEWTYTSV